MSESHPFSHRELRRRRLRKVLGWLVTVATFTFLGWGFIWEPGRLIQRDYTIALPHWSLQCDGLRVDVVSDLHTGSPRNGVDKLDRVVQQLSASDSDVVILAGDYVILKVLLGKYVTPEVVAAHLKPLLARKRVYAVLGNHDWWKNGMLVRHALEADGITVLENTATETSFGQCKLWLVGVGDLWEGHPDIPRAFAAVNDDAPVIAITHNPELFRRMPARASLVIAGHTHGGQVNFLPGQPSTRFGKFIAGPILYDNRQLFVTPGIGTSILPFRFRVPPEISRLTLRSAVTK
jgi:predicted MPP superfamily phosphohydrolase